MLHQEVSVLRRQYQGELLSLGYRVGASTVRRILMRLRVLAAPDGCRSAWWQFLHTPAATVLACDLFHVDCAQPGPRSPTGW